MIHSWVHRYGPPLFSGFGPVFIVLGAMNRVVEWVLGGALLVVLAVVLKVKERGKPS